jgi:hypothetical protein
MSDILSEQLTAVATLALAVLALAAAVLAYLKQSKEVTLLLEQNKRDTDERRRAQAARVFLGAPPDEGALVSPYARNASDLPVYEARIRYGGPGADLSEPEYLGTLWPGDMASAERQFSSPEALLHTVLTFRDAAGIRWMRFPDGELGELELGQEARDRDYIKMRLMLIRAGTPSDQLDDPPLVWRSEDLAAEGRLRRALRAVLPKRRPWLPAPALLPPCLVAGALKSLGGTERHALERRVLRGFRIRFSVNGPLSPGRSARPRLTVRQGAPASPQPRPAPPPPASRPAA